MSKNEINLKSRSKKTAPVLSIAYLDKHIDLPNNHLKLYLTKTRKSTLKKDLIHLSNELIGAAKAAKIKTTGLTRIKNDLIKGKIDVKDYFAYQKTAHKLINKAKQFSTLSKTNASQLFNEAKFTTKKGELRKRGRKKTKIKPFLTAKRISAKMKRLAMQQLDTVIVRILKTEGLAVQAMQGEKGHIDFIQSYLVNHIMTTMNNYVVGVDLMAEMFADFVWLPDGSIADVTLTPKAYKLAKQINNYIEAGNYAGLAGFKMGKLKHNAPAVKTKRNKTSRKLNKK